MNPAAGSQPDTGALRRFVRETLGCTCPDEVLDRIETEPGNDAPYRYAISVGGRLLVLLADADEDTHLDAQIDALLRLGRERRDGAGFNRLRLVLLARSPAAIEARALARFLESPHRDDRTHLHCLPLDARP